MQAQQVHCTSASSIERSRTRMEDVTPELGKCSKKRNNSASFA